MVATIGTKPAPITEKQPLMPQAQRNMWSLPSRPSVVMAVGIGKPIRKVGGASSRIESSSRAA